MSTSFGGMTIVAAFGPAVSAGGTKIRHFELTGMSFKASRKPSALMAVIVQMLSPFL